MKSIMVLVFFMLMSASFGSNVASATLLFTEDFEGDLSAWTGKYWGDHSGEIVADPLNSANQVLNFTDITSRGDMFTIESFTSKIDLFRLEFDYFGDRNQGGAGGDLGGFVGFTIVEPGLGYESQGTLKWLAGSMDNYPLSIMTLPDTGQWVHVTSWFMSEVPVHLVFEDFQKSYNNGRVIKEDVFFDNIELWNPTDSDEDLLTPTPEPATMFLMGSGLLGLAGIGKRRKTKLA